MFNHLHQTIIMYKIRGRSLKGFDLSEVCVAIMEYYS